MIGRRPIGPRELARLDWHLTEALRFKGCRDEILAFDHIEKAQAIVAAAIAAEPST